MNAQRIHHKIALSLIVCNLLVVVTFTYRFWHRDREGDDVTTHVLDDDFTTPLPQTTSLRLTTVDLADYPITQVTESSCASRFPT